MKTLTASVLSLVLVLVGCQSQPAPTNVIESIAPIAPDPSLIERLPPSIRTSGKLNVATDPTYPPMEFLSDGVLVGADIDLGRAIASTLGLTATFDDVPFSTIVPAVAIDRYDLGMSSLWADNRSATLTDMVTYLQAGVQLAAKKTTGPVVNELTDLCGMTVVLEEGTEYIDSLVRDSAACVRSGRKPIVIDGADNQAQATARLQLGEADVMLADSPAVSYVVRQSDGRLKVASRPTDLRQYGIAVSTTNPTFSQIIKDAVQRLIDSGIYANILAKWGLKANAIPTAQIRPARHSELLEMPSPGPGR